LFFFWVKTKKGHKEMFRWWGGGVGGEAGGGGGVGLGEAASGLGLHDICSMTRLN